MNDSSMVLGSLDKDVLNQSNMIPLESLSNLVGFPIDYLKKELLLEGDEVSLDDLRGKMLQFLETNFSK